MCLDKPYPSQHGELATVATDDVVMIHDDAAEASLRRSWLDQAFESHDVVRNKDTDVDMASDILALGCCLGNTPP